MVRIKSVSSKSPLWIADCVEGFRSEINGGPFRLGSSEACDFRVNGGGAEEEILRIVKAGDAYSIVTTKVGDSFTFDG